MEQCRLSNGLVVYSDSRTPLHELFKEVYRTHAYTQPDIPEIGEGDVVIDLGANIGMFTLFAANISPRVQVYSFEPAPETFALLRKNVDANNLTNVRCFQCAVSSMTGRQVLYIDVGSTADTMVASRIKLPASARAERVETISLDDLFARLEIAACDFLKVDVEGAEFDIFSSASRQTLRRVGAIAMEFHEYEGRRGDQLAELLESHGYCVRLKRDPNSDLGMIYARRAANGANGKRISEV